MNSFILYYSNMNKKSLPAKPDALAMARIAHKRVTGHELGDIQINVLIRLSYGRMIDALNRKLAPYQLNHVGYLAMMTLFSSPDNHANPSDLCINIGENKANVTRICDDLVAKGFLHRVTNTEDRRRVDLSLTSDGIALLEEIVPKLRQHVARLFGTFSKEEKDTFKRLLNKLNQALDSFTA